MIDQCDLIAAYGAFTQQLQKTHSLWCLRVASAPVLPLPLGIQYLCWTF